MLFCFYHLSFISTVHHIAKKNIPIVHSVFIICLYLCMSNKQKQENMKAIHQTVAKTLRYSNYNAKCVFNGSMEQPYEVIVKGITRQEANKLQQMFCETLKDSRINIINN